HACLARYAVVRRNRRGAVEGLAVGVSAGWALENDVAAWHPTHVKPPIVGPRDTEAQIIDIIGNNVYLRHANLYRLTKQTPRVPRGDRPDSRRVCASAPSVCDRLCGAASVGQDLGGQAAPTARRWWGHRGRAPDGRQIAFHSRLSKD